jgi:murein DD-endopeptidase MepM/ murein hydrolase activator NlpD
LQKSTDGVGGRLNRSRPTRRLSAVTRVSRGTAAFLEAFGARFGRRSGRTSGRSSNLSLRAAVRPFSTAERALPIAVALIVAVASMLALLPGTPAGTAGAAQGSQVNPRLAINGGVRYLDATDDPGAAALIDGQKSDASFAPVTLPQVITTQPVAEVASPDTGTVADDGTLITGYAPETTVEDGSSLIQIYKVKKGDTLSGIATKFHVTTMTLWWANKGQMKSKTDLHIGESLRIPPATGLIVTVSAADTLDSLAAKYDVDPQLIMDTNQLTDPTLVVGQVLVIPGALGAPIATPKPTPQPKAATPAHRPATPTHPSSGSSAPGVGGHYTGGRMTWPVIGGGNYISQYYHYGHWAIDIAAAYGSEVVAAAAGKVIFAGWKSNGGGWQVWISHGGNIYTTYNHMSAITVGAGQSVGRGQQVGRIGMSGDATGPHLHFEVWLGPIWNGGQRMNPLNYL